MSDFDHRQYLEDLFLTRRDLLGRMGNGFAALSLAGILSTESYGQQGSVISQQAKRNLNPLLPKKAPLPGKAKRVIFLFMNGGPSQVDTFDPKPALQKYAGQAIPLQLPTERRT